MNIKNLNTIIQVFEYLDENKLEGWYSQNGTSDHEEAISLMDWCDAIRKYEIAGYTIIDDEYELRRVRDSGNNSDGFFCEEHRFNFSCYWLEIDDKRGDKLFSHYQFDPTVRDALKTLKHLRETGNVEWS